MARLQRLAFALAALFLLGSGALRAQGTQTAGSYFEGIVEYKITYTGPDEEEVEANEPPKAMSLFLRAPDFILNFKGGRLAKSLLYINDSNRVYSIDPAMSRAFRGEKYRVRRKPPVATPTGDSAKILGRTCYAYRYVQPQTKREQARTVTLWITGSVRTDVALFDPKSRAQAYFLVQGVQGCIPLRIVIEEAKLTVVNEAIKVEPRRFSQTQFRLPPGISVVKSPDYRR